MTSDWSEQLTSQMRRPADKLSVLLDACTDGLLSRKSPGVAVSKDEHVRVEVRLVRGQRPRIVESYSILGPWGTWGDLGTIECETSVTSGLLTAPGAAERLAGAVRDRVVSMSTLDSAFAVSRDVVAGRDSRFGPIGSPAELSRWVSVGVWARVLQGKARSYGEVQGLLHAYHEGLEEFFSKPRDGFWADAVGVPALASIVVATTVPTCVMIAMGLER